MHIYIVLLGLFFVSVEASYEVSETEKNDLLMRYNHLREDVAKALFISNMHELTFDRMLIDRVSIMSCDEYENYISEIPEDMELLQSKLQGVTLTIPVDGYGVVLNLYNAYPPQTKLGCIHSKCKGSFQCILGPEEKLSSSGFVEGMPASNCTASTGLMCKPSVTAKGTLFTIILSIIHFI